MASRASSPPGSAASSSRKSSPSTRCRKPTTSGYGRITSATSSSASPISDVMLPGADSVRVSAAFFSPSHASNWSLSHHVASIPAMSACTLNGSDKSRFSSWMSARMKSNSAAPDCARMSRFKAAMDAWLRPISSVTMAGSVSIGSGAAAAGGPPRPSSGIDGMKPRSRIVCSASPISGSFPSASRTAARLAGEARRGGDVDEQPAAGLVHPRDRDQLVHGEPQGLHGVGHHLLVTDGDVDVVLPVAGCGDGEQLGDRPALDDLKVIVG